MATEVFKAYGTIGLHGTDEVNRTMSAIGKKGESLGKKMDSVGRSFAKVGARLTTFVTLPIAGATVAMTKFAADTEGAMSKFNVVFQGSEKMMLDWVDTFRQEFPIARGEIIKMSADLQDLLVPMGVARGEAANMTQEWFHLAGSLAAFNDVPIEEALNAIRSGIAGQTEPLRRFGVNATVAAIQAEAVAMGLIKEGQELDNTTKQMALLNLAYKQSADAVNGLEEQKGSLLWVIQSIIADVKDLATTFGQDLMPRVKEIAADISAFTQRLKDMDSQTRLNILKFAGLLAALGPILVVIGNLIKALPLLKAGFLALSGPVGWVALAVVALTGVFTAWVMKNEEARQKALEVWENIKDSLSGTIYNLRTILGAFVDFFGWIWETVGITVMTAVSNIAVQLEVLTGILSGVMEFILGVLTMDWKRAWEGLGQIVDSVWQGIVKTMENGINAVIDYINVLIKKANRALTAMGFAPMDLLENVDWTKEFETKLLGAYEGRGQAMPYDRNAENNNSASSSAGLAGLGSYSGAGSPTSSQDEKEQEVVFRDLVTAAIMDQLEQLSGQPGGLRSSDITPEMLRALEQVEGSKGDTVIQVYTDSGASPYEIAQQIVKGQRDLALSYK